MPLTEAEIIESIQFLWESHHMDDDLDKQTINYLMIDLNRSEEEADRLIQLAKDQLK